MRIDHAADRFSSLVSVSAGNPHHEHPGGKKGQQQGKRQHQHQFVTDTKTTAKIHTNTFPIIKETLKYLFLTPINFRGSSAWFPRFTLGTHFEKL
ncbi:MAG TPA: hypothetical protein PKN13_11525 [Accumulibacter sp.]|nr:hypothetical protein [Accumulibacter sp.]HMW17875.1 hypothetical protein [Accumulibacter sp.]HNC17966.1 hypothetical protein [Accumulibacter sp.]HND80336.1 hypothetical protein [Accumulibacter sp.]HNE13126.1 hypothetical protein [Accumulibacter sp.]